MNSNESFITYANDWCLFETLRLERGQYNLYQEHLERIKASASYFGIKVLEEDLTLALSQYAETTQLERERVRLTLKKDGVISVEGFAMHDMDLIIHNVLLSPFPIDSTNPFLYHKTTNREMYDRLKQSFPSVFDVLLWNEKEELTEFTIGNLVLQIEGKLYTPPIKSGLLPGTLRGSLLKKKIVSEKVLLKSDLKKATDIWLINSLRGWVKVVVSDDRERG